MIFSLIHKLFIFLHTILYPLVAWFSFTKDRKKEEKQNEG